MALGLKLEGFPCFEAETVFRPSEAYIQLIYRYTYSTHSIKKGKKKIHPG